MGVGRHNCGTRIRVSRYQECDLEPSLYANHPLVIALFESLEYYINLCYILSFPGGSDGKESACNPGDLGLFPGSGGSPGEGNGYRLQCSCPENPRKRGAWWGLQSTGSQSRTRLSLHFTSSGYILVTH